MTCIISMNNSPLPPSPRLHSNRSAAHFTFTCIISMNNSPLPPSPRLHSSRSVEHFTFTCIISMNNSPLPPSCEARSALPRTPPAPHWHPLYTLTQKKKNTLVTFIQCRIRRDNPMELDQPPGASTPYKRWSKCTMEKVGEAFLQKLMGEVH